MDRESTSGIKTAPIFSNAGPEWWYLMGAAEATGWRDGLVAGWLGTGGTWGLDTGGSWQGFMGTTGLG